MKRLITYDLDGTLVDTGEDIAMAANHMLARLSAPAFSLREIGRFVGYGLHHLVKNCLATTDMKRIEKGANIFRGYYRDHMLDHTRLYPGARKVLEYFKDRTQVVITNKPDPFSTDILCALGVADYFTQIVAGDSRFPKKPDPAAVLSLMEAGHVVPAEVLLVGDSRIDIETGRRAGVHTAIVTHGFETEDELKSSAPDSLFKDFRGLLEHAKEAGW